VFLPLATLRREVWWRNLALVFSMVLFGVWHTASLLFVLWGCYHGTLLTLDRQVQRLQRRLNWEPVSAIWTAISWVVTITLVSLGWVLFRANSLRQAGQMLTTLVSPSSYVTHFLPAPLYLLVLVLALAYTAVLLVIGSLDRKSEHLGAAEATPRLDVLTIIVRDRWLWLTPIYAFALLIGAWLLMRTPTAGASPFVYRSF
jgi:alginate O-acetyltransferase complex protein AlgI